MRHGVTFALIHLSQISHVTAGLWPGKYCFDGCDLTLTYVDFNDTDSALSKKIRTCQSVLHAKSLYLCISEYCEEEGREQWLGNVNETCETTTNAPLPPWSVVEEYTPEDVAGLRRLHAEEGMWDSISPPLNEVVIPEQAFFERAYKTIDYAFFEIDTHWAYGIAMFYFWGIVVSFGVCWRLAALIQGIRHREWQPVPSVDSDIEGFAHPKGDDMGSRTYALLKRFIIIPATFGYHCSQNIGWCTIPPRIQSLTVFSFILLNILLCSISYRVFAGNIYWPLVSTQLWRYVSDRTGAIALANFPLIWLFGTRNNVLMWLTGWGFGTYNSFHRWVARVATVQAVVHSIGYTEMIFERGDWSLFMKYLSKHYFWNGEVATVAMCALSAFSVYGLRRCHYEFFLVAHIVLSMIVLLTTFYHVEIFNGEWNIFIWPCLLVWVLDRAIRALRILAFNWRFWNTRATATYDHASNLVRLQIPCEQSLSKSQPGAYYYVYVLNELLYAHQSHPFTLAYVSDDKNSKDSTRAMSPSRPSYRAHRSSSTESESLLNPTSSSPCMVFLIRPYSGMTSRLRTLCASSSNPQSLRVLVEGPYGATTSPNPLHAFSSLLFITGGTGIAVALSYLNDSIPENVTDVHIVWAVREHAFLSSVLARDIPAHLLKDERLRITVHVTQDAELKDDIVVDEGDGLTTLGSGLDHKNLEYKAGRPDVGGTVQHAAGEVGRGGKLAVVACGPAQMADEARRACVKALGRGYTGVEYFEESFKW